MSGGSWDYVYQKVAETSERLMLSKCHHRRALGSTLNSYVKALHDIEWVDSGDYGPGDELSSIREAIGKEKILSELIKDAKYLIKKLENHVR